jgi:hypothetical protein
LAELVAQQAQNQASSWRAGLITPITDSESDTPAAERMWSVLSSQIRPVLVRVKGTLLKEVVDDIGKGPRRSRRMVSFQLELWRADLCTSVLELDRDGRILPTELPEMAQLYPPELVLGYAPSMMLGAHVSTLIPHLSGVPLSELFVGSASASTSQHSGFGHAIGPPAKRGLLKHGGRECHKQIVLPCCAVRC